MISDDQLMISKRQILIKEYIMEINILMKRGEEKIIIFQYLFKKMVMILIILLNLCEFEIKDLNW